MRLLFLLGSFGAGCCSGEIPSAEFQELVASRGSWPPSDWSFQLSGNPKVVFLLFSADLKLKNDVNVFFVVNLYLFAFLWIWTLSSFSDSFGR